MSVYIVFWLVFDVGVSVYIVCDYLLCGLLCLVVCILGGYGLFDDVVL